MCTVSLIARQVGYALGMNRDEKLSRVAALPPKKVCCGDLMAIFPSEPGGGTWIGVNERGLTFALINWYSVVERATRNVVSRGDVVRTLLSSETLDEAGEAFSSLPLSRINPFRVIGISMEKRITEWRWNLRQLNSYDHPWLSRTWISSGFNEPGAQRTRGNAFAQALNAQDAETLPWLRRLHASHHCGISPYSTCMHRDDAQTVSYTEVNVEENSLSIDYCGAPPCRSTSSHFGKLRLKRIQRHLVAL